MVVLPSKTILEPADIGSIGFDPNVLSMIGYSQSKEYEVVLFAKEGRKIYAITTNTYPQKINALTTELDIQGYQCEFFYTSPEGFEQCLSRYDSIEALRRERESQRLLERNAQGNDALSMIKYIYTKRDDRNTNDFIMEIVRLGYQAGASDVHFQAQKDGVVVRLRIDGVMNTILTIPHDIYFAYGKKLKFIAGTKMNIDHIPQDGRFSITAKNTKNHESTIDVRASFMPGILSDNTVLRFLDSSQGVLRFDQLGMNDEAATVFRRKLETSNGLILITGPTGSGKTTTLYSILGHKNTGTHKIITLEDPIEYQISGIQQSQINYGKGYDYYTGLKACMRQDPDVLLVGETRTPETAETVVNAALTGHLVFTTLHTTSAIDAIPRMLSMDVKNYLLAPSLEMIVAQRLVRKLCPHCLTRRPPTNAERGMIRQWTQTYTGKRSVTDAITVPFASGCTHCQGLGYRGRIAIHEVLDVTSLLKDAIIDKARDADFLRIAMETPGYMPMVHDGYEKMIQGFTTLEEIQRVLV